MTDYQLPPPCLTVPQAARALGVSGRTMYRMCSDGEIGYLRVGKSAIRIQRTDLEEYINRVRQAPWSDPELQSIEVVPPRKL